jgi:hypothetical protein
LYSILCLVDFAKKNIRKNCAITIGIYGTKAKEEKRVTNYLKYEEGDYCSDAVVFGFKYFVGDNVTYFVHPQLVYQYISIQNLKRYLPNICHLK